MGMFDYVYCDYSLLSDPPPGDPRAFQTKDLENMMDVYRIIGGRLVKEIVEYEDVPLEERPPPPSENASWIEKIRYAGSDRRERSRSLVDDDHHGYIVFYTSTGQYGQEDYGWHEYRAKFTDGRLVEIVKIRDARP